MISSRLEIYSTGYTHIKAFQMAYNILQSTVQWRLLTSVATVISRTGQFNTEVTVPATELIRVLIVKYMHLFAGSRL